MRSKFGLLKAFTNRRGSSEEDKSSDAVATIIRAPTEDKKARNESSSPTNEANGDVYPPTPTQSNLVSAPNVIPKSVGYLGSFFRRRDSAPDPAPPLSHVKDGQSTPPSGYLDSFLSGWKDSSELLHEQPTNGKRPATARETTTLQEEEEMPKAFSSLLNFKSASSPKIESHKTPTPKSAPEPLIFSSNGGGGTQQQQPSFYQRMTFGRRVRPRGSQSANHSTSGDPPSSGSRASPIVSTTHVAKCEPGARVSTTYGPGIMTGFRKRDGMHIVTFGGASSSVVGYITGSSILDEIKASVGDRVVTQWGSGPVTRYDASNDLYFVQIVDVAYNNDKDAQVWTYPVVEDELRREELDLEHRLSGARHYQQQQQTHVRRKYPLVSQRPPVVLCPDCFCPFGALQVCHIRARRGDFVHVGLLPAAGPGVVAFVQRPQVLFTSKHRNSTIRLGEILVTKYGPGIVRRHRPLDRVFELDLVQWTLPGSGSRKDDRHHHPRAKLMISLDYAEQCKRGVTDILGYPSLTGYDLLPPLTPATSQSSVASRPSSRLSAMKAKLSTMAGYSALPARFQLNERVLTPFGSGFIREIHESSEHSTYYVYAIKLRKLRVMAYLQDNQVEAFPHQKAAHYIVEQAPRRRSSADPSPGYDGRMRRSSSFNQKPRRLMRLVTSEYAFMKKWS